MNAIAPLAATRESRTGYASIEQMLLANGPCNELIRLHCNEMPFDLPRELKQKLATKMADLAWNRYPDFYNTELTTLIATHAGVCPENVLLGNGSSQLIQQLVNCFSKFISIAVIEQPTFTFYHQVCQNERMPYQEWALTENGVYNFTTFPELSEPALVMLTSPNNPTGTTLPLGYLQMLLNKYPQSIFVIDEAYGEFGSESAIKLINKHPNLLVLKTLSKGYGMPGIRFGYVAGSALIIKLLKKHTVPFTINIFTELVVREFLTNPAFANAVQQNRERVKNLREFVYHLLDELSTDGDFSVQPSAANFLLLRFRNNDLFERVQKALSTRNILVSYPMSHCLRLTIGTEGEMNTILRVIKQTMAQHRLNSNVL